MRAAVITAPHQLEIGDAPDPAPGEGEVVIRVAASGICGTDLHIWEGEYAAELPVIPGHEFSGTVVALGRGVHDLRVGDRVTADPNIPCLRCSYCHDGRVNLCDNYAALGGTEWWAGAVRLALMAAAIVLSAAFFALLPRGTHWWTHFGQYTMYVYLLHSFVLYPFRESGLLRGLDPTWIWLPLITVLAVAIAFLLASKPVRRVFRPLIEPRPKWMFTDAALSSGSDHRSDPTGSRRG